MTDTQKLDHILATLQGFMETTNAFIQKQEAFNSKQEAFNSKQEDINTKLLGFVDEQKAFNARMEVSLNSLRRDFEEFRHDESLQHNMTHRLIAQAFEHISDLQSRQPWEQ